MNKIKLAAAAVILVSTLPITVNADSIRTKDGISCSNSTDKSPLHIETYVNSTTGSNISNGNSIYKNYNTDKTDYRMGVKMRYYFGAPKPLECHKLYNLELRSKQARLEELEAKIALLKVSSNINWNSSSNDTTNNNKSSTNNK